VKALNAEIEREEAVASALRSMSAPATPASRARA
jgi:hypothetical protein